jgi:hypothetical protein
MDANAIEALLLIILQDRVKYRDLVNQRGPEAQSLLNLLQAVCIFVVVCPFDRNLTPFSVWSSHWTRLSSVCTLAR